MPSEREIRAIRRGHLERLATFMHAPVGRSYIYNLLESCHMFTTSFGTNALAMAHREGERNVGLRITADLMEACPDRFLEMLKEASNVRYTASRQSDSDTDSITSEPGAELATYPSTE